MKCLQRHHVKAALFVAGTRVDDAEGRELLKRWDDQGHLIGSHSYSHLNFNAENVTFPEYRDDFLRVEPLLATLPHFERFFRFPYLKEGETTAKRDEFRDLLRQRGYRVGHVSIDASDWYISKRLEARLRMNPKADTGPYRDYFLDHIIERANYYRDLSRKTEGRDISHTVLLHHNILNALFLSALLDRFKKEGWEVIDAKAAFSDSVYLKQPNVIPAGESILWSLAKETGKFEDILRYPAESDEYEQPKMDKLGL